MSFKGHIVIFQLHVFHSFSSSFLVVSTVFFRCAIRVPRDTFLSFEGVHLRHDERVIDVFPEPQMALASSEIHSLWQYGWNMCFCWSATYKPLKANTYVEHSNILQKSPNDCGNLLPYKSYQQKTPHLTMSQASLECRKSPASATNILVELPQGPRHPPLSWPSSTWTYFFRHHSWDPYYPKKRLVGWFKHGLEKTHWLNMVTWLN